MARRLGVVRSERPSQEKTSSLHGGWCPECARRAHLTDFQGKGRQLPDRQAWSQQVTMNCVIQAHQAISFLSHFSAQNESYSTLLFFSLYAYRLCAWVEGRPFSPWRQHFSKEPPENVLSASVGRGLQENSSPLHAMTLDAGVVTWDPAKSQGLKTWCVENQSPSKPIC